MTIQLYQNSHNKRSLTELNSYKWNTSEMKNTNSLSNNPAKTQLDEAFEPIAIVTPPKKRAKSDTYLPYNFADAMSSTLAAQQRRYSLQLLDLVRDNQNPLHPMNSSNWYGSDSMSSMYNNRMPTLTQAMRASAFGQNHLANGLSDSTIVDDFEPLFIDHSTSTSPQATSFSYENMRKNYPDACSSSTSSLSTTPSSSFEEGQHIIQTSDSFKENGYTKAEVIAGDVTKFNISGSTHNISKNQSEVDLSPNTNTNINMSTSSVSKSKNTITPPSTPLSPSNQKESSRFKPFHEEKWNFHFEELLDFKKTNGHCLVPHTYPEKPHLARWVKRQRRQYKLKLEGNKNSTMTDERIKILNDIEFVWDSHEVIWNERFSQLVSYKQRFGHCRVPSYCKECPQLASWVKCQRRQYKLFWEDGKGSSMNLDRIKLLNSIGFIWEVHPSRKRKESDKHFQHLAQILMDS